MNSFILGFILGALVGVVATILVFRRNKGIEDTLDKVVDDVRTKGPQAAQGPQA